MKKLFAITINLILAASILTLPFSVLAAGNSVDVLSPACAGTTTGQVPSVCKDQVKGSDNPLFGPSGLITLAVQILAFIVGIAAVITLIISGLRYVLSSGDPSTASSARNAIIYAVAGLVVALTAQVLVSFVLSKITV